MVNIVRKYGVLLVCLLLLAAVGPAQGQEFAPDWQDIVPGYWEPSALPLTGLATYYAAGLMESVQWRRESSGQLSACPECVGAVALLRAGDIGRKVWLQPPGGEPVGPFLVVDCARRQDVIPLLARNWAVDISYELGQIWGMRRPLDGVIVLEDPADSDPAAMNAVRSVPTRFFVEPENLAISAPTPTPTYNPAAPTRWPTRLPGPLPGRPVLAPPTIDPYAPTPTPTLTAGPPLPTPLTPVVTTPTPLVTPVLATPEPAISVTVTYALDLEPQSATPLPEVSLGQAGSALLTGSAVLAATGSVEPVLPELPLLLLTPTRTPRPNLTPLLPEVFATPVPPGPTEEPLLLRLWRELVASFGGE
jgi:hypothetical protein